MDVEFRKYVRIIYIYISFRELEIYLLSQRMLKIHCTTAIKKKKQNLKRGEQKPHSPCKNSIQTNI